MNSSGLRLIRRRYREGQTSTRSRIPGLKEFLNAEKDVGAETSHPSSPHETQAEVDEALNEYGSNLPFSDGVDETSGAEPVPEAPRDFVPLDEPPEHLPQDPLESSAPPSQPVGAMPEETTPVPEPTVPAARGLKRPGPPRTKRLAQRVRREASTKLATGSSTTTEGTLGVAKSMPDDAEESPMAAAVPESETRAQAAATVVSDSLLALTAASTPSIEVPPAPASESRPSPATPSSFDLSQEYGVSVIRNSFLTILRESPTQVLERGGDFAGIKSVLEPLLDVMQSLTNATATLPFRTYLVQAETLFNKWQRQRDQSLHSMIEDRTMQLMRVRDDTQFELQRQILEKKQTISQLGEVTATLHNEKKRVAEAERNQQLLVDSYKAALVDIQTKLAEAESGLEAATERHQTLMAQWTAHQAAVQAESDDLEGLSVAVSQMPVLSDDDLYKQATEEIKVAHKESMVNIATEIRRTLENL